MRTRCTYQRRSGWRIRPGWRIGRWIFGYERRDYEISLPVFLVWPTMWREKPEPPLAPALQLDIEAFERRKRETIDPT
jgi:hypothetical protein